MPPRPSCPILLFRQTCTDAGVHALSFLAVLSQVESGDSCRKIAVTLAMPYSTVWRAVSSLVAQGLISLEESAHPGGTGKRYRLGLSDTGRKLIDDLTGLLTPLAAPSRHSPR
jgi:DNA-binding MarR family transcriptional regulator